MHLSFHTLMPVGKSPMHLDPLNCYGSMCTLALDWSASKLAHSTFQLTELHSSTAQHSSAQHSTAQRNTTLCTQQSETLIYARPELEEQGRSYAAQARTGRRKSRTSLALEQESCALIQALRACLLPPG